MLSLTLSHLQMHFEVITADDIVFNSIQKCFPFIQLVESTGVDWLASGILKQGVPGSISSRGTTVIVECPWASHTF